MIVKNNKVVDKRAARTIASKWRGGGVPFSVGLSPFFVFLFLRVRISGV